MSNKIIDEQKRARREFIKLKKMQSGEMAAPKGEQELAPKTFEDKLKNFWYHFKWQTIFSAFLIVVIAVSVVQCANRERFDVVTVLVSFTQVHDVQIEKIEEYLTKYATDINGDGKVNVQVVNCSFNQKNGNAQVTQAKLQKLQSTIISERETILYLVDEQAEKYINSITEDGVFENASKCFGDDFYEICEGQEIYEKLPKNLKITYRRIKGTILEKNKKSAVAYKTAKELFEKIPTKKTEAN